MITEEQYNALKELNEHTCQLVAKELEEEKTDLGRELSHEERSEIVNGCDKPWCTLRRKILTAFGKEWREAFLAYDSRAQVGEDDGEADSQSTETDVSSDESGIPSSEEK